MANLFPLIVGGLVGLVSLAVSGMISYRNFYRLRYSLVSSIEQAEKELADDFEKIAVEELVQTLAGSELLKIRFETEVASDNNAIATQRRELDRLKSELERLQIMQEKLGKSADASRKQWLENQRQIGLLVELDRLSRFNDGNEIATDQPARKLSGRDRLQ